MVKRKLSLSEWEKWSEDRDRTERTNLVLTFLANVAFIVIATYLLK